MSGDRPHEWRFYLDDMIEFAENVLDYTRGLEQADLAADKIIRDAVLRNLELIGEAANRIPNEVCSAHPEIPWRRIIGARNRFIHGYRSIAVDTLWSVIRDDVPELLPLLKALRAES